VDLSRVIRHMFIKYPLMKFISPLQLMGFLDDFLLVV
jgi:hypothetical protein